jgi:hypothetical protein
MFCGGKHQRLVRRSELILRNTFAFSLFTSFPFLIMRCIDA